MRKLDSDDVTVSRLVELYFDPEFEYDDFRYNLHDWGGYVIEKLSESSVTRFPVYKIEDEVSGDRGQEELQEFFDNLIEVGVASRPENKMHPTYDLSPLISDRPLSMGYELFLKKVEEAERQASWAMKEGQSELDDFVE